MKLLRIATTTLFLISGLLESNALKIAIQAYIMNLQHVNL